MKKKIKEIKNKEEMKEIEKCGAEENIWQKRKGELEKMS